MMPYTYTITARLPQGVEAPAPARLSGGIASATFSHAELASAAEFRARIVHSGGEILAEGGARNVVTTIEPAARLHVVLPTPSAGLEIAGVRFTQIPCDRCALPIVMVDLEPEPRIIGRPPAAPIAADVHGLVVLSHEVIQGLSAEMLASLELTPLANRTHVLATARRRTGIGNQPGSCAACARIDASREGTPLTAPAPFSIQPLGTSDDHFSWLPLYGQKLLIVSTTASRLLAQRDANLRFIPLGDPADDTSWLAEEYR